ncbi:hypothetical protein XENOCAPTIV_008240 [Xenoophorus captivus]|uniref:PITH domain-containing protein n=1 Tax=Xenoophorus captivus TaxID=1517983 RepID=A0ABV0QQL4_9TELE
MVGVKVIGSDPDFQPELAAAGSRLAVVKFTMAGNRVRVDQYQGADAAGLEEKIKQHTENDPGNSEDSDIPKGYMDLMPFVNKAGCECLNESDDCGFDKCLIKDSSYLESDCDEQVKPSTQAPKVLKVFINLPRSMDFDDAERSEATQTLELLEEDYKDDGLIPLRYVKFQNVQSVTVRTVTRIFGLARDPNSSNLILTGG